MKILCSQEHYDKVVQYAESIGDTTLQKCLERLKSWEKNPNRPCEIELYYDFAPYLHIPADTRSAFPLISVHSPVSIQYRWQS